MIYAFDTYYNYIGEQAHTVCIGFNDWSDADYSAIYQETIHIDATESEYISGAFYKRELPSLPF